MDLDCAVFGAERRNAGCFKERINAGKPRPETSFDFSIRTLQNYADWIINNRINVDVYLVKFRHGYGFNLAFTH